MSSLPPAANGNSGGSGGKLGGQGGARGRGGGGDEVSEETIYHYAVAADFDMTAWSKLGTQSQLPTCDGRMQALANVITKNCPGTQLAPLPHVPGGENLPSVGRADKTADDIFTIPKDQWKKYAMHVETIKERSTGKLIYKGVLGLKSNLSLKQIKERTEVSAFLRKKGQPTYLKVHNCSAYATTRIGVLYNIHANLVLHDELAEEITRVCGLKTDAHGRREIEVTSKRTTFNRGQSIMICISGDKNNATEIKSKLRENLGNVAGTTEKVQAMAARPLTHNTSFVSFNNSDVGDVVTPEVKERLCRKMNLMYDTTEATGLRNMRRNGIDTPVTFNLVTGPVTQTVRQWLATTQTSEKDPSKQLVINSFPARRDGKLFIQHDKSDREKVKKFFYDWRSMLRTLLSTEDMAKVFIAPASLDQGLYLQSTQLSSRGVAAASSLVEEVMGNPQADEAAPDTDPSYLRAPRGLSRRNYAWNRRPQQQQQQQQQPKSEPAKGNDTLSDVEKRLALLDETQNANDAKMKSIETDVSRLTASTTTMLNNIEGMQNNIASLQGSVSTMEKSIASIATQMNNLPQMIQQVMQNVYYRQPSYQQTIPVNNAMTVPQNVPLPHTPQRTLRNNPDSMELDDETKRKAGASLSPLKQRGNKSSKPPPNG